LKDLGMTEASTVIREHTRNPRWTRRSPKTVSQRGLDQAELSRADNLPAGLLPNLNNQPLFCDFCASSWRYFFSICFINRSAWLRAMRGTCSSVLRS